MTKDLEVIQYNTGNGKWLKNDSLLYNTVNDLSPDIVFISESNMDLNCTLSLHRHRSLFKD